MPTEFKQLLETLDLEQLDRLRRAKQAMAVLEQQRQALQQQIGAIDEQLAALANGSADPAQVLAQAKRSGKAGAKPAGKRWRRTGQSLANQILEVLRQHPEGLKVAEITQAVRAAGYSGQAKNLAIMIGTRASQMPELERVSHGVYRCKQL